MDQLITEGIRLLAKEGTGWILFLFASAAAAWLLLRLLKSQQACADQTAACTQAREAIQEKRIAEARESVTALTTAAATLADLVASMKERTNSVDALVVLVKQVARDIENNSGRWQERVAGIEARLDNIANRVEDVQMRIPPR